ncbi:MAG: hypothetical protein GX896_01915 [Clostridiales bacterium]|nr:hypothetical protein [Clostridiales bacterium]
MTIKKAAIPYRIITIITFMIGCVLFSSSFKIIFNVIERKDLLKTEMFFNIIKNWTEVYYPFMIALAVCFVLSLVFIKANDIGFSLVRTFFIGTALRMALYSYEFVKEFQKVTKMGWIDNQDSEVYILFSEKLKLLQNVDNAAKIGVLSYTVVVLLILSITSVVAIVKALNPIESYVAPKRKKLKHQEQFQQQFQQNFQQQAPQPNQHQAPQPNQQQYQQGYQQKATEMSEPLQNYQQDYAQQPPQMEEAQQPTQMSEPQQNYGNQIPQQQNPQETPTDNK